MMKNSKRPTATRSSSHPEPEEAERNILTDPGGLWPPTEEHTHTTSNLQPSRAEARE